VNRPKTLPEPGQWIRWLDADIQREGQLTSVDYPGFTVEWLGVGEQNFPWGCASWPRRDMEIIPRPPSAAKVDREKRRGRVGIATAAATLGTTPKRVRQLLRDGKLKGTRREGKWVAVELEPGKR
jgi:hypothetical protein